jgi:hypothetical protein
MSTSTLLDVDSYFTKFVSLNSFLQSSNIESLTDSQFDVANRIFDFCSNFVSKEYEPSDYRLKTGETAGKKEYESIHRFTFADGVQTSGGDYLLSIYKTHLFVKGKPVFWFADFLRWMCKEIDSKLVFYFLVLNEEKEIYTLQNGKQRQRVTSGMYNAIVSFSSNASDIHKWSVEFRSNKPLDKNILNIFTNKTNDIFVGETSQGIDSQVERN